jgi:hypothetical protein
MYRWLAPIFGVLVFSGCATGAPGSSRRICYEAGFQPHTQEFTDCWHRIRSQQFSQDGQIFLGMLGIAAASQSQPARGQGEPLYPQTPPRRCVYWTPQGQRVVEAINGICPARYGQ